MLFVPNIMKYLKISILDIIMTDDHETPSTSDSRSFLLTFIQNAAPFVIKELIEQNLIETEISSSEDEDLSDQVEHLSDLNLLVKIKSKNLENFLKRQNNPTQINTLLSIENFYEIICRGNSLNETIESYISKQDANTSRNFKIIVKNLPDNFRSKIIGDIRTALPNWRPAAKRKGSAGQDHGQKTNKSTKIKNDEIVVLRVTDQFFVMNEIRSCFPYSNLAVKSCNHRQKIRPILSKIFKDHSSSSTSILRIFGPTSLAFNFMSSLPFVASDVKKEDNLRELNLESRKCQYVLSIFKDAHPHSIGEREKCKTQHKNCDFIISNTAKCLRGMEVKNHQSTLDFFDKDSFVDKNFKNFSENFLLWTSKGSHHNAT